MLLRKSWPGFLGELTCFVYELLGWVLLGDNIGVTLCACRRGRGLGLHGK